MTKIISILNQKGGVGKTTTAINLSVGLAKAGNAVLLVDLDPQGNATSGLGIDKMEVVGGVYDALISNAEFGSVTMATRIKNLNIIPTNSNLASAEVELSGIDSRETKLKDFLFNNTSIYDYVLIDCPPSLGLLTVNALTSSTDVIVPVQTEYYAMEGLSQLLQVVQHIQGGLNPTLQIIGVLLTMYDSRTSLSEQVKEEIVRVFGDIVFSTVIPRNIRLAEAPSHGKSIYEYDKWSKGSKAYKSLTKEVINRASK
jgi:chromosome partitioning protein